MTAAFTMPIIRDPGVGEGRAEIGSEQWARRIRAQLGIMVPNIANGPKGVAGYLRLLREREGWRLLTDKNGRVFTSLEDFCETPTPWGLGTKLSDLERWIRVDGPASAPIYWTPPVCYPPSEDDTGTIEVHPAAHLFPMLPDAALADLAADIAANGLREPIVLWEGQVIDGRNRMTACQRAGVPPTFTTLLHCPDPVAYVLSANLHRRHLTESQRSVLAARVKPMQAEQARARMMAGVKTSDPSPNLGEGSDGRSAAEVAQMFNVGRGTVETAAKLLRQGVPELVTAVERGEVAVSAAAAVSTLPAEEQREVVAGGKDAIKAKAREIREAKPKREARPPEQHPLTEAIRTAPDAGALDAALTAAVRVPGLPESVIDANASAYQARKAELRAAREHALPDPPPPAPPSAPASGPAEAVVADASELERLRTEVAELRGTVRELRTENALLSASNEGYREWLALIQQRIQRDPETVRGTVNLDRVRKLVELAGSPSENEARSAAMLACRMIRGQNIRLVANNPLHSSDPMERALRDFYDLAREAEVTR